MIFSKLTSATLFFLLALTATGRPNLKLSEVIRSRESSWDPSGVKHFWDHEDDYDHGHDHEDDYWDYDHDHDHDHDYDHDEHYWDGEDDDDHYWGYYDSDYEHDYHHDWDYDHDNDWDENWDHDWDSSWGASDWDAWDNDWDSSWDRSTWDSSTWNDYWISKWYSSWASTWNSKQDINWDNDEYYNPNYEYGALQVYAGAGTVYTQDGLAGSCGIVYNDDAFIAALGNTWMNGEYISSECGRQIRVTNLGSFYPVGGEGNSIIVTVMDTCATCDEDHIDLSIAAWNALTDDTEFGLLNVEWSFVNE